MNFKQFITERYDSKKSSILMIILLIIILLFINISNHLPEPIKTILAFVTLILILFQFIILLGAVFDLIFQQQKLKELKKELKRLEKIKEFKEELKELDEIIRRYRNFSN